MGLLNGILKLGLDVVFLPVSVVADVMDVAVGEKPTNTLENVGEILDDIV